MALKTFSNSQISFDWNAVMLEVSGRSNARQHQDLGTGDGSGTQDDLTVSFGNQVFVLVSKSHSISSRFIAVSEI
jgi:hypothetical protein